MNADEIAELRRLESLMEPGRLSAHVDDPCARPGPDTDDVYGEDGQLVFRMTGNVRYAHHNARALVALRNAAPALLDAAEKWEKAKEVLRGGTYWLTEPEGEAKVAALLKEGE